MRARPPHPPYILIASRQADTGLALQQLCERNGYMVLRCLTAAQALERARSSHPDVIVLDESLADAYPLEMSRELRDDPLVGPSTPILLITTGHPTAAEHHHALRAGVWEFITTPFNGEEVAARLHSYVLLRFETERARGADEIQDSGGLYTTRGLALRAHELTLQAFHHGAALACVALAPLAGEGDGTDAVQLVAQVLKAVGRRSDAIGRTGPGEFAVVAPGTDGVGAVLLAQRLSRAVRAAVPDGAAPALRAGYDAVGNARYAPVEPKNLLARATSALRVAKSEAAVNWIRAFEAAGPTEATATSPPPAPTPPPPPLPAA
jgi:PleD family two-component response regulator